MKASLPRRMTLHAIEAAFLTRGYKVAREMADVLGALVAQDATRSRPRVRCPECGKELGQEAFRAHRRVVHGR